MEIPNPVGSVRSPMARAGWIVALLAVASFAPGAQAGSVAEGWDRVQCANIGSGGPVEPSFGCTLLMRAVVSVPSCAASSCLVVVNASSIGSASVPGLVHTQTAVAFGDDTTSVCVGTKAVSDALEDHVACGRLCERLTVGTFADCRGETSRVVDIAPGGPCEAVWVSSVFAWNEYGGIATISLLFDVCRLADGTPDVLSYGGNGAPPPPPSREPPQRYPPWDPRP